MHFSRKRIMTLSVMEQKFIFVGLLILVTNVVMQMVKTLSSTPLVTTRTHVPVLARCSSPYLLVHKMCVEYMIAEKHTQWIHLAILIVISVALAVGAWRRSRAAVILTTAFGALVTGLTWISLTLLILTMISTTVGLLLIRANETSTPNT
jgi:hypothetical protein